MRLFVVRHGQTSWNVEGRAQGHSDVALDETGQKQAELLAASFANETSVKTIYSSDLARARSTAEAIGKRLSLPVTFRPGLREVNYGDYEGKLDTEIRQLLAESAESSHHPLEEVFPPNGESNQQVWERLKPFVSELAALQESAIVVGHGSAGAILMAELVLGTLETRRSFRFGNTGYFELERRPTGHWALVRCNVQTHLEPRVAT